jgi:hypothetical protein
LVGGLPVLCAHSLRRAGVDLHDAMTIEQFYPLAVEHCRVERS